MCEFQTCDQSVEKKHTSSDKPSSGRKTAQMFIYDYLNLFFFFASDDGE